MSIAFFEEVLSINNTSGKHVNCFSAVYDKINMLSEDAKLQLEFVLDIAFQNKLKLTELSSIWLLEGPNYRLTLMKNSIRKDVHIIAGTYNCSELLSMNYYIKDDFTAIVYAGEVVAILPYNIEE